MALRDSYLRRVSGVERTGARIRGVVLGVPDSAEGGLGDDRGRCEPTSRALPLGSVAGRIERFAAEVLAGRRLGPARAGGRKRDDEAKSDDDEHGDQ